MRALSRLSITAWPVAAGAFMILFLVALSSWIPFGLIVHNLSEITDDVAFILSLSYLAHAGAQWGPDVVFTYGPLGYLSNYALFSDQWKVYMAFRISLALTTSYLIVELIQTTQLALWKRLIALAAFTILAFLWFIGWFEAYWVTAPFVLFSLHLLRAYERSTFLRAAMLFGAALIGTAALVKFSFTVIYFGLFILMAGLDATRRRIPWEGIVFVVSMFASWVLAGQALSNYPVWISTSLNLSEGYSAAMAKGFFEPFRWRVVALVYLSAILLVASAVVAARSRIEVFVLSLAALGFAMVNIQHSFGGNQIEQSLIAMISSAAVVMMVGRRKSIVFGGASIVVCMIALPYVDFPLKRITTGPLWFRAHYWHAVSALTGKPNEVDFLRERMNGSIRKLSGLPEELTGTADVYVRKTGIAMAYPGLRYTSRPSFLSLNAHTKRLADDNAAFLASPKAPDYLIFESKPEERVNGRYQATDDGPSWPLIWSKYALQGQYGDLALYRRRQIPIEFRFKNERRIVTRPFQTVAVDPARFVWATIDIRLSLLGELFSKIYKAPNVFIQVYANDGTEKYYQIVPELGRAGFLLSPVIRNGREFAKQDGPKANSFAIVIEHQLVRFFIPDIQVTMSELEFSEPPVDPGNR